MSTILNDKIPNLVEIDNGIANRALELYRVQLSCEMPHRRRLHGCKTWQQPLCVARRTGIVEDQHHITGAYYGTIVVRYRSINEISRFKASHIVQCGSARCAGIVQSTF
jgi:hypothetical protein